ncbi:MAG: Crp/Fnr family transcriptional regulator [Hyphomicrobiales bacterium]
MYLLESESPRVDAPVHLRTGGGRAAGVRDVPMRRGETLFRTGDGCERLLVPRDGRFRVQAVSRAGREIVLYRVGPGEICMMSAMSLLCGSGCRADAVVEADGTARVVIARQFHERLARDDAFRAHVLNSLGHRMHGVVSLLQDVAFERVNGRLAQLLLSKRDACSFVYETHETLALELGSAREVVSRRLKAFERKGWVKLARGKLQVLDEGALSRVCESCG